MDVLGRVSHGFSHILTGVFEDEAVTTRMVRGEFGEIVDLASVGDPEGFGGVVYECGGRGEVTNQRSGQQEQGWCMIFAKTVG
jgi:hypothetical protein